YQARTSRKQWWKSTQLRVAASIIVAVGVLAGSNLYIRNNEVKKGVAALQEVYTNERPVEARISGWTYAPKITRRGPPKVDDMKRERAEGLLQTAVHDLADARSLYALGQSYLAKGEFDKAIDQFEAALNLVPNEHFWKFPPRQARIESDLGAAFFEKSQLSDTTPDKKVTYLAEALTHLTQAVELDDSLLEPLFNRALVYENLGPSYKAEQDWRRYIEKDPNSKWAEEAGEHLKQLQDQRQKTSQTP